MSFLETDYDVLIIGAGVAGLASAMHLARKGLRVAVIEKNAKLSVKVGECVTAAVLPILNILGVKEDFLKDSHQPLQSYRVKWGVQDVYERHLVTSSTGSGWILNRQAFDTMLYKNCCQHKVKFFFNSELKEIEKTDNWSLVIKGEKIQNLSSHLLIDSSGRSRVLARMLKISAKRVDKLMGSCCHVTSSNELPTPYQAVISSYDQGWWYYAQWASNKATLCYFSDSDLPMPNNSKSLLENARKVPLLKSMLNSYELKLSQLKRYPAYSSTLFNCTGDGWLAIGDAASSFDPLSSYGITSSLSSAFYGSQAALKYFNNKPEFLLTYQGLMQQNFLSYLKNYKQEYTKISESDNIFWQRRNDNLN